jgi:hypothetical protein
MNRENAVPLIFKDLRARFMGRGSGEGEDGTAKGMAWLRFVEAAAAGPADGTQPRSGPFHEPELSVGRTPSPRPSPPGENPPDVFRALRP